MFAILERFVEEHNLGFQAVESGHRLVGDPDTALGPGVSFVTDGRGQRGRGALVGLTAIRSGLHLTAEGPTVMLPAVSLDAMECRGKFGASLALPRNGKAAIEAEPDVPPPTRAADLRARGTDRCRYASEEGFPLAARLE